MTQHIYYTGPWLSRQSMVHVPARLVVAPTGVIIRGLFPSVKARRMVSYEQLLERDLLYLCDFAPQVVDIREQPFKFQYAMGNKIRRYTPDFALIMADGSILVIEVKPARSMTKPGVREKFQHIKAAMQRQGHQFILVSSESIRAPHRLDNLKRLHRFLRQPMPFELLQTLRQLKSQFGCQRPIPMGQLEAVIGSSEPVLRLLAHGQVSCDLDQPITARSLITLTKQEASYVFVNSL
ncbi:TnsA endonuclease N-terminal domain-containing protein [Chromobacterium haemolyticum]|uniref:TnsA endonuclease N-terminal domain-containing protein n=1 Tax=Chromobacterium haemolyticum TaxID=394935 RepID=UPI00244844B4|nr:TnsA endonuclease N-terminal domain-containing protein [Chromobacterium haemolyticum]MDH0341630.1 TnsA endonuclease N-terminal domain-containing protein [Chromobacterium haemolyticum]